MSTLLVISSALLSESSIVLDQPEVRHELVRLAAAMETSDGVGPAPLAISKAVTSVDSCFPFAGYLKTSTAKLISWQSLRALGKVALVAQDEGSTLAQLAFEGETTARKVGTFNPKIFPFGEISKKCNRFGWSQFVSI